MQRPVAAEAWCGTWSRVDAGTNSIVRMDTCACGRTLRPRDGDSGVSRRVVVRSLHGQSKYGRLCVIDLRCEGVQLCVAVVLVAAALVAAAEA
jgi:hypothetical protein